jgi:hypothetical protein
MISIVGEHEEAAMQLKYHQATYDLLTQTRIDVKPAIDEVEAYLSQQSVDREWYKQKYLAWTTLDLYQHPVTFSPDHIAQLDALEQRYQITLPAAIREWYSLDIGPAMMTTSRTGGTLIPEIKPLDHKQYHRYANDHPEKWKDFFFFLEDEYAMFAYNEFGFQINVGENPPVAFKWNHVIFDYMPSFSDFLYLHFRDWLMRYTYPYEVELFPRTDLKNAPPLAVPFSRIRQQYTELKMAGERRFYDAHVWIQANTLDLQNAMFQKEKASFGTPHEMLTSGICRAADAESLKQLIHNLWGSESPLASMMSFNSDLANDFLDELRRDVLLKIFHDSSDWLSLEDLQAIQETVMPKQIEKLIKRLIEEGLIEAHPDNSDKRPMEQSYRLQLA